MSVAAVVLAAGAAARYGGGKLLAVLEGRPLLAHVVDAARSAHLDPIVVVVPPTGELDELELGDVRRVVNPDPAEGLSSSVRLGLRALELEPGVDAAAILPGDQPRVRAAVIETLVAALEERPATPFVVPRYTADQGANPVIARRSIWRLADELAGDRGFGPVLGSHPELVRIVNMDGANPDVDTVADLDRLVAQGVGAQDGRLGR